MVFLLLADVAFHSWHTGLANGKRTVTILPIEIAILDAFGSDPFRRATLGLLHEIGDRHFSPQAQQDVNVIRCAAGANQGRIEVSQNASVVFVQRILNFGANQWGAILGAENQMDIDRR
jgi:hypothetical protein